MLGEFFIGLSAGLIFSLVTTVLVELIPSQSGMLVALNSLGRNIFGAIGTSIAQPLLAAIDNGWLFTIAAVIILASSLSIVLLKRYGQRWREALAQGQTS